jgi:polyisoprenoid-binding protein YceI
MTIRADSLAETDKEFDEKDRQKVNQAMRSEALETGKFPTITFKSTDVAVNKLSESRYQAKITGALTLHGVTHPISFPAQVTLDGNVLRATGGFTVTHGDYKMKRISAGGGTVKAEDAIKLSFSIVANKT